MAQQTINIGASPNDGTGTPLRTAFQYTNSNFSELYTAVGPSGNNIVVPGNATITGDLTVATDAFKVISATKDVCIGTVTPTFNNKLTVVGGAGGDAFITGNLTISGNVTLDSLGFDDLSVAGSVNSSNLNTSTGNITLLVGGANTAIYSTITAAIDSSIAFSIALG